MVVLSRGSGDGGVECVLVLASASSPTVDWQALYERERERADPGEARDAALRRSEIDARIAAIIYKRSWLRACAKLTAAREDRTHILENYAQTFENTGARRGSEI